MFRKQLLVLAIAVFALPSLVSAADLLPLQQGEKHMVMRAKMESERFELGDKCYLNGHLDREFEVRGVGGAAAGPFQRLDVGGATLWSHQVVADLPEIEVVQMARADTIDPRAIEAVLRDGIMAELRKAGVDLSVLQQKPAAAARAPALQPKQQQPQQTKEELLALLAKLEEGGSGA